MPELIDHLVRFFKHGEDEESGVEWSVSGGGLEGNKRHYRIYYCVGGVKKSVETTIDVEDDDWMVDLSEFLTIYRNWSIDSVEPFRSAVAELCLVDHWLATLPLLQKSSNRFVFPGTSNFE